MWKKYILQKSSNTLLQAQQFRMVELIMGIHSSEITGLRSTKCSSRTLQNLLFFMYKKTRAFIRQKYKVARNKKWKKTTCVFIYIKYSKFWSVSLEHFVERKPVIYEEWGKRRMKAWILWNQTGPSMNNLNFPAVQCSVSKGDLQSWLRFTHKVREMWCGNK